MDAVTRRKFLLASGVTGVGALMAGTTAVGIAELLRKGANAEPGKADQKLVLVTLYGGNDGLNTVVPYADGAYYRARPDIAYAPERVLRLDAELGLNPKLTGLKRLWDEKHLAILRGVGYPRPDRSHFRSMDIWQTAAPLTPVHTGWVGRWLDGTKAVPEAAVSFEPVLPVLLAGETRAGACVSIGGLALPEGIGVEMVAGLGHHQAGEPHFQAQAATSYTDLLDVEHLVRRAEHDTSATGMGAEPEVPATGTGGASVLSTQLALVARCVEAGVPTRVYSVSLGGFDTHAKEVAGHELLLGQLDTALTSFVDRMATTEAGRQVTVLVYSEFGRRVHANASEGTDHGTAGPVFVLGHRVAGGFYGEQPSLTDLDDGDLKSTMDFRQVFGTVLGSVLQADPAKYITGFTGEVMPFIPAG